MKTFRKTANVGSVSEKLLIARILSRFGNTVPSSPFGAGDDCALIEKSALQKNIYATSDAVILGRHFDHSADPRKAGSKLLKRNASDIAAMGATPFSALTSSILSKSLSLEWLDAFCDGLAESASMLGVKLIGGDVACVSENFFSMHISMLGHSNSRPLLRSGAREGDYLYTTGALGRSYESGHHFNFIPRLREGAWLASRRGVGACTDISDGLASDLRNIIPHSLCAELSADSIPLREWGREIATIPQALCDGEDYELLFSYRGNPARFESDFNSALGYVPYRIGTIKKASSLKEENALILVDCGRATIFDRKGFDHSSL